MYVTAEHLREQVIRPTLKYLGVWNPGTETFLLDAAVSAPDLGLFSARNDGLGLFHITAAQHRDIWDRYLAFKPDMASRIRGLASQRAFLSDPDSELTTNLSYCTAIAWLLYQRAGGHKQQPAPAQAAARFRA
ncbi:hypothetical protein [Parahaliea mediterranea]|uniref:hypothetical protein n=1 Tax=Parahaliea mediterranea TaxID=651086 RepID=UPI000E2F6EC6|nr:hypothetical protein [Parahaliea mediterranea]